MAVSAPRFITCCAFNQDNGCFAVGTETGFCIFTTEPLQETSRRDIVDGGGFKIVSMLFRTNVLALVGTKTNLQCPPNKVMLWDDHAARFIGELAFKTEVKAVLLRHQRIAVVLESKVYVYLLHDLSLQEKIETGPNPRGLCCMSVNEENSVLACPGLQRGTVRVSLYDCPPTNPVAGEVPTCMIMAHQGTLSCIAVNQAGTMVATASETGTLIRVFSAFSGELLHELRRGVGRADLYLITFNPYPFFLYNLLKHGSEGLPPLPALGHKGSGNGGNGGGMSMTAWLAACSDTGTVHIFRLEEPLFDRSMLITRGRPNLGPPSSSGPPMRDSMSAASSVTSSPSTSLSNSPIATNLSASSSPSPPPLTLGMPASASPSSQSPAAGAVSSSFSASTSSRRSSISNSPPFVPLSVHPNFASLSLSPSAVSPNSSASSPSVSAVTNAMSVLKNLVKTTTSGVASGVAAAAAAASANLQGLAVTVGNSTSSAFVKSLASLSHKSFAQCRLPQSKSAWGWDGEATSSASSSSSAPSSTSSGSSSSRASSQPSSSSSSSTSQPHPSSHGVVIGGSVITGMGYESDPLYCPICHTYLNTPNSPPSCAHKQAVVAFGPQESSIVVLTPDGLFCKYIFDSVSGGECVEEICTPIFSPLPMTDLEGNADSLLVQEEDEHESPKQSSTPKKPPLPTPAPSSSKGAKGKGKDEAKGTPPLASRAKEDDDFGADFGGDGSGEKQGGDEWIML
eukprot:GILI01002869.1.p1 GENE.GILI01002869.1~~GILI01002869.1.p1  ORF type:complete len:738 (+),score=146.89 GILI01002869.1:171-2384(+)